MTFGVLSADDQPQPLGVSPADLAVRAVQTPSAAELQPEAYRDAVIFTAAGTDVTAGPLPWARSGVASNRQLLAAQLVALGGNEFLVSQPWLSKGWRYVRVDAQGRLSSPTGSSNWPSEESLEVDLAAAADGRILLAAQGAAWWIGTDGRPSRIMRASDPDEGIAGVAVLPNGDAIVADAGSNRIVRIAAGEARTVAGNGSSRRTRDGGSALSEGIGSLGPIAAFADGSFLLTQQETTPAGDDRHVVRRVDAEGRITTVAGGGTRWSDEDCLRKTVPASSLNFTDIDDLLALPAGDFLLNDRGAGVIHVSVSGQLTQIVCVNSADDDRFSTNLDGRRASRVTFSDYSKSIALTDDGTLLITADSDYNDESFVAMLAPTGMTRRLAVAIAPKSHATIPRHRVVIAATHPAVVAIRVVQRRRVVVRTQAEVPAGRATVALPKRVPAGDVDILVSASAPDGRVAADRLRTIVPSRRGLPVASVRRLILRYVDRQAVVSNPKISGCKAIAYNAVRCRLRDDPEEDYSRDERWTVRRTRDGILHATIEETGEPVVREVIQP